MVTGLLWLYIGAVFFYIFKLRGISIPIGNSVFLMIVHKTKPLAFICAHSTLMGLLLLLSGLGLIVISVIDSTFSSGFKPKI